MYTHIKITIESYILGISCFSFFVTFFCRRWPGTLHLTTILERIGRKIGAWANFGCFSQKKRGAAKYEKALGRYIYIYNYICILYPIGSYRFHVWYIVDMATIPLFTGFYTSGGFNPFEKYARQNGNYLPQGAAVTFLSPIVGGRKKNLRKGHVFTFPKTITKNCQVFNVNYIYPFFPIVIFHS